MAEKYRKDPVETPELLVDRPKLIALRKGRWAVLRKKFGKVRAEVADWAERMEAVNGPVVQIHENELDWVTALYVVRYGENEAYWPEQLSDDDVRRAEAWEVGRIPLGVKHLKRGG